MAHQAVEVVAAVEVEVVVAAAATQTLDPGLTHLSRLAAVVVTAAWLFDG